MKLLAATLVVIAFVFVVLVFPHDTSIQVAFRTIGMAMFLAWIAILGVVVGFHMGVDAQRNRQSESAPF